MLRPLGSALLLLALLGCGDQVKDVPASECASGLKWNGGNEGSSLMRPGGDCIGCHAQGEGPRFAIAGTVYPALDQANDCFGVQDATVEITDANGAVFSMKTNEAGNFYLNAGAGPVAKPYTAKVLMDGMEIAMATPQTVGNCASCHTHTGANLAAGRIYPP